MANTRDYGKFRKGYRMGGAVPQPEKTPMANDPKMNIERELERNRDKMIVREPDTNYEARPGTDDESDKFDMEKA